MPILQPLGSFLCFAPNGIFPCIWKGSKQFICLKIKIHVCRQEYTSFEFIGNYKVFKVWPHLLRTRLAVVQILFEVLPILCLLGTPEGAGDLIRPTIIWKVAMNLLHAHTQLDRPSLRLLRPLVLQGRESSSALITLCCDCQLNMPQDPPRMIPCLMPLNFHSPWRTRKDFPSPSWGVTPWHAQLVQ